MYNRRTIVFTAFLCLLVGIQCAYCQQDAHRFLRWTVNDPVDMFSNIGSREVLRGTSVGLGIAAISLSDGPLSTNIQDQYKGSPVLNFTNRWGEWPLAVSVSAGIFGASLLTKNSKFQDVAFTSLQSLVMTNLTVNAGKFLFARKRPHTNEGPYEMEFAELGHTSLPSGHTATAFALVTPWVIYYPNVFTYSMMAIPVGTAIARVAKGRHWLSDVTAGAAIGFSMGYYLSKKHLNIQSKRFEITPSAGSNSVALRVNFSF
ncbi:phosphatase PAP2 family protein [Fodinibius sp. Rm-B-1B1-1]|uniref:phosphatase PAP2 family protein n=1 Tax=Fodinibius alkaliphilus TaxID=3140241 RepID=UPI00315A77FC